MWTELKRQLDRTLLIAYRDLKTSEDISKLRYTQGMIHVIDYVLSAPERMRDSLKNKPASMQ